MPHWGIRFRIAFIEAELQALSRRYSNVRPQSGRPEQYIGIPCYRQSKQIAIEAGKLGYGKIQIEPQLALAELGARSGHRDVERQLDLVKNEAHARKCILIAQQAEALHERNWNARPNGGSSVNIHGPDEG